MGTDLAELQHPIFTKDPEEWVQYLHKEVYVGTTDGCWHHGWVYTIDPVSESLVLIQDGQVEVVMGHAVQSMALTGQATEQFKLEAEKLFPLPAVALLDSGELERRRQEVVSWLETNRLPVEVKDDIICVCGALEIEPPYTEQSCFSTNEIILGRIQGLLSNLPG